MRAIDYSSGVMNKQGWSWGAMIISWRSVCPRFEIEIEGALNLRLRPGTLSSFWSYCVPPVASLHPVSFTFLSSYSMLRDTSDGSPDESLWWMAELWSSVGSRVLLGWRLMLKIAGPSLPDVGCFWMNVKHVMPRGPETIVRPSPSWPSRLGMHGRSHPAL